MRKLNIFLAAIEPLLAAIYPLSGALYWRSCAAKSALADHRANLAADRKERR